MAIDDPNESLLDNAIWHALKGPQARFAAPHSVEDVVHFDLEVSVFSAVDQIDETVWNRIADLAGLEGQCGLFRDVIPGPPPGWEVHFQESCWQMVAGELLEPSGIDIVGLGEADASEMVALAELTEPGPFFIRTHELGRYVGVRRDGRLMAMAGERFRVPGFVEVSAVCTHPDARGEGLAAELTLDVVRSIRAGGDQAFLHVLESNENALRLYQKLGFSIRRKVDVVFAQWHGPDWRPVDQEAAV